MLKYWLWLTERPGLTNQVRLALLRHFGTPEAVYYADPEELLLTEGITAAQVQHLSERNLEDAENIEISEPHQPVDVQKKSQKTEKHHPGYGEGGKFHNRKEENPLPEGETLTFALVGNQNCGKTTLFNQLTGSRQHVGNFPGVTVDRQDGVNRG